MSAPVSEGDIILDKYRVERVLGQGGMGVVVAATHVELDQKVALKFLLPTALEHEDIVERFAREAKAAARIQSRHVVRVIDTGRMPSGAPFMVMEYLEGEDLADLVRRSGPLPLSLIADYMLQACEAVGEAHAAGIVHRDLKPSNVFLAKQRDRRSIVKVLDFGISKLATPDAEPLTLTTAALGSPHYMSPEQLVSSKHVDPRSDIWSLGVILYELASGVRPFRGDTMPEVVAQVLNNEPVRLNTLRSEVPLEFENVVSHCLTTEAERRYATVAELAEALRPFASDAAAAAASVERTARVLGAASIPPGPPAGGEKIVIHVDMSAAPDLPATLRPPRPTASADPAADLEPTITSPAVDVAAAPALGRTRGRAGLYAGVGAVALVVGLVGLRGRGVESPGVSPVRTETASSGLRAEPSAAPPVSVGSASEAASQAPSPSASVPPPASGAAVATITPPSPRPVAPAPRPPVATSSAIVRPPATRENLNMDLK